ncbi:expressed unknown protein [Seminavis robusta]|uniref:Uncharacterized protein n=1 Tax=Seminavis robusta TaxID=568900 RepID=A0A9N8DNB4_9STRA|nr:expressed unknown protein [Seminavis robusta]|eukprot:Sro150_g068930.1 n/a (349) ;mRNA; r:83223-84269
MASVVGHGRQPPAKRQRQAGPVHTESSLRVPRGVAASTEDEATAKRKLREAEFDPNDCRSAIFPPTTLWPPGVDLFHSITPMTYFCFYGDLPMCRYVHSHGGATTRAGGEFWFPMYAAIFKGNMEVVQWLFQNGAKEDVVAKNSRNLSPWCVCWNNCDSSCDSVWRAKRLTIAKWLLVQGAIGLDARALACNLKSEGIDGRWKDHRPQALSWSTGVIQTHDAFQTFLMGTLVAPDFSMKALHAKMVSKLGSKDAADIFVESAGNETGKVLWEKMMEPRKESPVQLLSGNVGVLRSIADFVGAVALSAGELQTHRRLAKQLPQSWIEYPNDEFRVADGSDFSDEDDGDY